MEHGQELLLWPQEAGRQVCRYRLFAACRREHVSIELAVQGRLKGSGKMDAQMEFLTGRVKAQRGITMPERAAGLLAARGVKANPAPLSRVFCSAGFT